MTTNQLREIAKREPFEPFTIHMADGSKFKVTHPESLFVPPEWSTNAILARADDRFSFIYLRNVTHISSRGKYPNIVKRRRGEEESSE
ncbi:MAG TPA: hypothetical protein VN541_16255 [Tepidisphaeraceae bacterium]|nr:hypothetical protein [Tepidisphaeraceae bacterium]